MAENGRIPKAVWTGTFNIFGFEMKCAVLDDGQRVIDAEGLEGFLSAMEAGTLDPNLHHPDEDRFYRWIHGEDVDDA